MSDAKQDTPPVALRSQMLRRAGIAGGLIVVLLAALAWFESQQREEHAEANPPLVMAPPPPERPAAGAPPMPSAAEVEAAVAAEGGAPEREGVTPAAVEPANLPPVVTAPAQVDETPPAVVGSPRLVLKGEDAPARKAVVDPEHPAPAAVPPKPAKAAADGAARPRQGYLVQLGVFSASDNAQALHDKVVAMGIEAHIESRVVVGPFKDRAAADAAREKLLKSGLGKGLVVRAQ
ncbi:SPOR domain-containing protein [Denitromonas iodatirespirans]|uniref:SPOR domain-containing protein n=1 Tax=Denitromonas iodatirespirans TaxID=2795389 RepID=A0A944HED1_DENI1|nr:SPOR domain-containing protein [Denitromonas iodatirespirans]MBT0962786.1 SPOR domain-containing protein [Denitromonas iodatirespirans]